MSHCSRLHERIRSLRPLVPGMHRSCGYECSAPLQRDISELLEDHGHGLDAAVAAARPGGRPDDDDGPVSAARRPGA